MGKLILVVLLAVGTYYLGEFLGKKHTVEDFADTFVTDTPKSPCLSGGSYVTTLDGRRVQITGQLFVKVLRDTL